MSIQVQETGAENADLLFNVALNTEGKATRALGLAV